MLIYPDSTSNNPCQQKAEIRLTYMTAVEDRNRDITLIINYEIKSVLSQSGICYYKPPFHQPPCIPSSHPNLAKPILKVSIYPHLMIKIPVYEFPPVINIATIQDKECQTGNRFRESPEYLVGKINTKNPGRDQRFKRASMRSLSNPVATSPSTTRAGTERTPRPNSSSRASSSIIRSFTTNEIPLPVRYSASAEQGPQKGCEYTVILWSPIWHSLFS